jgi:phage terminase large subunit-like protein
MSAALTLPSGKAMPRGAADLATLVSGLPHDMQIYLDWQRRWSATARPSQLLPETDWTQAGILAGRGFGKTRVGAEWITRAAYEDASGFDSAVIAPTYSDVKYTCFEGESGILSVLPPDLLIDHNKSDMIVKIKNIAGGVSTIRGFTAEKPERLRGPQHCRGTTSWPRGCTPTRCGIWR